MQFRNKWGRLALAALVSLGVAACDGDDPSRPAPLGAPANVQVSRVAAGVQVTWDAASGAATYTVERATGISGAFASLAAGITQTSYTDATASASEPYQYRVVAVRGAEQVASNPVPVNAKVRTLVGPITSSVTLSKDTTYVISGLLYVNDGGVLNIPAGTKLVGDTLARPSALIVRTGGRIEAKGTAQEPIVFTSMRPEGRRKRQDWGGIVINGRSLCNFPAPCQGEAGSGQYGGTQVDDNSGTLRYVRIEYAGFEVSQNNELNALTLNGVGRGTTIEHIQVHYGSDDGIELFGGTVDIKYALATGISDDSFDYSTGWQGRGQFWIAQQDPAEGDRGFEVDGNENVFTAQPYTDPVIYNVTLVGKGSGGSANASPAAFQLRRGTRGKIFNAIVMGWNVGIDVDDAATVAHCADGGLVVANSIFHQNTAFLDGDSDTYEETCAATPAWAGLRQADPGLGAPYDRTAPNFQPAAGSAATRGAATPPNDGFFTRVDYVGAVAPTGTPWYQGWTTFAQN